MKATWLDLPELKDLGKNIMLIRLERGMSQTALAQECGLSQAQISLFESERRLPSLDQFIRIARALDVSLRALLGGPDRLNSDLRYLAVELRGLGAMDLWVADAVVPAALRRPEEIIALAVSGTRPDPRVVETIPALLSWNLTHPSLLATYGEITKTTYRLAWLADIALSIDRHMYFPGGCRLPPLERFLKMVDLPPKQSPYDDLGMPMAERFTSPIWRRWKISYGATLDDFAQRALTLSGMRDSGFEATEFSKARARAQGPRKECTDG